jgi:hypothetical protein
MDGSDVDSMRTDLEIIRSALDSLFTSTLILEETVAEEIVRGLGRMSSDVVKIGDARLDEASKDRAIFGIVRILEIALVNI